MSSTKAPEHVKGVRSGKVLDKRHAHNKKKAQSTTKKGSKAARAGSVKQKHEQATTRQIMAHVHRLAWSPQGNDRAPADREVSIKDYQDQDWLEQSCVSTLPPEQEEALAWQRQSGPGAERDSWSCVGIV